MLVFESVVAIRNLQLWYPGNFIATVLYVASQFRRLYMTVMIMNPFFNRFSLLIPKILFPFNGSQREMMLNELPLKVAKVETIKALKYYQYYCIVGLKHTLVR